jgi:hypothetical protein
METFYAASAVLVSLLIGLILFCFALHLAERTMKRKVIVKTIFNGFQQKMWMTAGLGITFFGLYLLIIIGGSYFNELSRLDFFFLVYQHPVFFIYCGLLIFATISSVIYLVRLVIKFIYNRIHF